MTRVAFCTSALAGLLLSGSQFLAQAQVIPVTNPGSAVTSGIVGVTNSQTARLNVLNLQPVIAGVAAVACPATLEFYNDAGKLLLQSAVTNISPAKAISLVFPPPATTVTASAARTLIRAVVTTPSNILMSPSTGSTSPTVMPVALGCNVMASLEIIDNSTGATHTFTTDFRPVVSTNIVPLAAH